MKQLSLDRRRRCHVAIMRKTWGLTKKILTGEKTIESRWYFHRSKPWNDIESGDTIYFKDSGEPVTIKAIVGRVLQFDHLTPEKVKEILKNYGKADGIADDHHQLEKYFQIFRKKKYCLLIFLKNFKKIEPFNINKAGFGMMSAWLTVVDINQIKLKK